LPSSSKIRELVAILLAVVLAVVGLIVENTILFWIGDVFAGLALAAYVWLDSELKLPLRIVLCVIIAIGVFVMGNFIGNRNYLSDLAKNQGVLVPASNDDAYGGRCAGLAKRPGALIVNIGGDAAFTDSFPYTILELDGDPVLKIDRVGNKLAITQLKIIDDRADTLATIDAVTGYWVKEGVHWFHPDKSTIVVRDHLENEVLNLRFTNRNSLTVTGIFRDKNGLFVRIDKRGITTQASAGTWNSCLGGVGLDDAPKGLHMRDLDLQVAPQASDIAPYTPDIAAPALSKKFLALKLLVFLTGFLICAIYLIWIAVVDMPIIVSAAIGTITAALSILAMYFGQNWLETKYPELSAHYQVWYRPRFDPKKSSVPEVEIFSRNNGVLKGSVPHHFIDGFVVSREVGKPDLDFVFDRLSTLLRENRYKLPPAVHVINPGEITRSNAVQFRPLDKSRWPDVVVGNAVAYVVMILEYRDQNTPLGLWRHTETCIFVTKDVLYLCKYHNGRTTLVP
jgi:hypothetical protein